jgi:ribose transport system substrate-binding protein
MKNKVVLCLLVLLLALPLASFAGGTTETKPAGQITVGLTLPGLQFPFFVTMKNDFDKEAAKLGVKVIFIDAQNDSSKQVAAIESFVSQKVNGILISPMTTDSQVPAIEEAVKAGIPVATVDRKANTDKVLVHVGADNVEGGRAAGRYVIDKLGGKGSVIELEGTPGASPAIDRKKGFDEVINASAVKILVSQAADFNRAKANSVMENLMQAYPKFDAVFGANDEMIIGAIEAMSAAGIDPSKKVTVGYDATTDALDYIRQGKLGATIDQFPGKQAAMALNYLIDFIKDKKQPPQKVIYIAPEAVTSAK